MNLIAFLSFFNFYRQKNWVIMNTQTSVPLKCWTKARLIALISCAFSIFLAVLIKVIEPLEKGLLFFLVQKKSPAIKARIKNTNISLLFFLLLLRNLAINFWLTCNPRDHQPITQSLSSTPRGQSRFWGSRTRQRS